MKRKCLKLFACSVLLCPTETTAQRQFVACVPLKRRGISNNISPKTIKYGVSTHPQNKPH